MTFKYERIDKNNAMLLVVDHQGAITRVSIHHFIVPCCPAAVRF